jgi:hypothetical protein
MDVLTTFPWLSSDRRKSSTYWRRHMRGSNLNFSNWKEEMGKWEPGVVTQGLALVPVLEEQ